MNKYTKRIVSIGLAAALAAGTCLPALAESSSLSKEENVYAVMRSDGTIQSTTVSDHLHSAGGLSAVTDNTTLADIQNTQSDATFAQNGTALQWNTDDTDVYYKGTTTQSPPVTASIHYTLDGNAAQAEELAGKSGRLVMNIALTNHETGTVETAKGGTRPVVTPFITVVGAVLNDSFANVSAEHGLVQGDGGSQLVGFACLPGVKGCVSDLLGDTLSDLNQYLLDTVTITADVTDFKVPSVMIACATDTSLLGEEGDLPGFEDLGDLDDLQADTDKLTDAMDQLTDGATQLDDGATKLNNGAADLNDGAAKLDNGAADLKSGVNKLDSGAADLNSGAAQLDNGAATLNNGTITLKEGADKLNSGAADLKDGTAQLRGGAADLKTGAQDLNTGLNTLSTGLNTLAGKSDALNSGAQQIANAVLATANTQLNAAGAITGEITWDNYAAVLAEALGVNDTMRAAARRQLAQTVKDKTGADLNDQQLNALIYLTAVDKGTNPDKDLTAAVTEAGSKMGQAAAYAATIAAAQTALVNAGGNPLALPEVIALLQQMAAASQPATQSENESESESESEVATGESALAEESAPIEETALPEEAAATVDTVAADPLALAYQQLCGQITQETGITDAAELALLVTLSAQSGSSDLTTALHTAGANLANANEVNNALTLANNGDATAAALMTSFLTGLVSSVEGDQLKQIEALNNSLAQVQGFVEGLKQYTAGVATAAAGAATAYAGSTRLAAGAATLCAGTVKADDGAGALKAGLGTLAGGVAELKEGAATLKTGTSTLLGGTGTLKSGTTALAEGADTLKTGTADLKKGTADLKTGTTDLKDGTAELKTGVNKLNSEGISKLTDSIDADQLATLKDVLSAMKDRQTGYASFTGAPDDATVSLRFVLKTAEATKEVTAETAVTTTAPKMNLWQRILNLFGLYQPE